MGGRTAPLKIHKDDLDPVDFVEVEQVLLLDIAFFENPQTCNIKSYYRPYIQGECNPYRLPNQPRTQVEVSRFLRRYLVDGKEVLVVDLRNPVTDEVRAERREAKYARRKERIPGGAKGRQVWRVTRKGDTTTGSGNSAAPGTESTSAQNVPSGMALKQSSLD